APQAAQAGGNTSPSSSAARDIRTRSSKPRTASEPERCRHEVPVTRCLAPAVAPALTRCRDEVPGTSKGSGKVAVTRCCRDEVSPVTRCLAPRKCKLFQRLNQGGAAFRSARAATAGCDGHADLRAASQERSDRARNFRGALALGA